MFATTYMIRVTPLGFVRRKMENLWIKDFLFYIPFCVLSAMTFPDVLYSTTAAGATPHVSMSAIIATMVAQLMSWRERGLVLVAVVAVAVAVFVEMGVPYIMSLF